MLDKIIITGFNCLIEANPQTQAKLQKLVNKAICLGALDKKAVDDSTNYSSTMLASVFKINFVITPLGTLEVDKLKPDCIIDIPIAALSHLIHGEEIRTLKQVKIDGDYNLGLNFLSAISTVKFTNLLYQENSLLPGIIAVKLETFIKQIIEYAKLVVGNAGLSTSQYLQYESEVIAGKYELEEFYNQVDELKERCQLLTKRLEKLMRK